MTEDYGRTHVPVGTVSKEWIHEVETHQKKKLVTTPTNKFVGI